MRFEKWQALGNDYVIVEARGAALGADRRAGPADLRAALRGRLRRDPAALRAGGSRPRRRPADLQPRRLRGRAVGQRRPRGGALPAPGRLDRRRRVHDRDRRRADHADDHLGADLHAGDGHGRARPPRTTPTAPRTAAASSRRPAASGASSTSRSATRSARSRPATSSRSSTWPRSAPRSRTTSSSRTAPTSASTASRRRRRVPVRARIFERGVGETLSSGTGASGAAVAAFLAGAAEPAHGRSSTAASSRSRSATTSTCG